MSKVAIKGADTGTGVFTLESPATNTDRTLTIPDVDGSIVTADASGNVGIGTDSPIQKLDVQGAANTAIRIGNTTDSTASLILANTGSSNLYLEQVGGETIFSHGSVEHIRIDSSGILLVGKTSDSSAVGTQGINLRQTGQIVAHTGTGSAPLYACRDDNGDGLVFYRNEAVRGKVVINASSVSYNTTSDYRLKENVVGLGNASSRVLQLNPVRFNFIGDSDTVDGFLAHEAQAVVPEAVTGEKDAVNEDGSPNYQGIDQSKLVPLLTAALQEALARIETLEADVATLKGTA